MEEKLTVHQVRAHVRRVDDVRWEIPRMGPMRAPGRVFASEELFDKLKGDDSLLQVAHVASLPGICGYSFAMPDIHWGYGFPIGGVAAFHAGDGVVSPGGVGYDINCGVRTLTTRLSVDEVGGKIRELVAALFHNVPSGVGSSRKDLKMSVKEVRGVLEAGARWAVGRGYGSEDDLDRVEDGGCIRGADPSAVSDKAIERGHDQLGTLGSGNHFIELGVVEEVYDSEAARVMGLFPGQVTVTVHTGSRGLGYQVCDDTLAGMKKAVSRYDIPIPDPQLCCAPLGSPEARQYLGAMRAAANFAFANRQIIAHYVSESLRSVLKLPPGKIGLSLLYDLAHNIAKIETHAVDGREVELCVHRKGATRSFGPGHPSVPGRYRGIGQPVIVPGDMGTCSYILLGTGQAMSETFGSTCHGAGRVLSRHAALKSAKGRSIAKELEGRGVCVVSASRATLAEEMPEAYKDVTQVVQTVCAAGLNRMVVKLRPLGVVKG